MNVWIVNVCACLNNTLISTRVGLKRHNLLIDVIKKKIMNFKTCKLLQKCEFNKYVDFYNTLILLFSIILSLNFDRVLN